VELSKEYGKEAEARSLASMLALRKAMKSFGIKNAVSFHSSIRKAQNASQVQDYISKHYDFKPIDSFTVDGKMATGKREVIINEFADSPKALITNARCLTEGVDVPNIDCIVFADPRRSKIDIVQALGRALRKKEGKEWGYVILPVVYDGDTHEIDNDNFKEIIGIIRGLAANDERIIDHFKDKNSLEKSGGGQLNEEQFMFLTETLDESEFKGQLSIKLWEGLSRFRWVPFEEARRIIHRLKISSYKSYVKEKVRLRSMNIPVVADKVYENDGWISWGDFLGTGYEANKEYFNYHEAQKICITAGIKTGSEYKMAWQNGGFPKGMPSKPNVVFRRTEEWISWGEFLNTGRVADHLKVWRDFEEAKDYARGLKLPRVQDWVALANSGNLPVDIPKKPQETYRNKGWRDFGDWLGIENARSSGKRKWRDFNEARKWVRGQNLSSHTWRSFVKRQDFPKDIPMAPDKVFKNQGWIDWSDFLGTGNVQGKLAFKSFKDARIFVRGLGLKNQREWFEFAKTSEKPIDIPTAVVSKYKDDGWKGWKDFLGTDKAE